MNYRSVLETFKLAVPEEVALQFSHISTLWQRSARSGELWWTYCQHHNIDEDYFSSFTSPLEAYKSLKAAHFIVSISDSETLLWYDCDKRRFEKRLNVPLGVILKSMHMVLMGDLSVVVIGGGAGGSAKVTRICRDGRVVPFPKMMIVRERFGVVEVNGRIYVFGGEHKQCELSSSEALNTTLKPIRKWVSQGSMLSSRADFTPAAYHNRIYICGGGTTQCEVYDLSTRSFEPIDLILPVKTAVCALILGPELLLITSDTVYGYFLDTFRKRREKIGLELFVPKLIRPVIRGNHYFCASARGTVLIYPFPEFKLSREVGWEVRKVVKYVIDAEFNVTRVEEIEENPAK